MKCLTLVANQPLAETTLLTLIKPFVEIQHIQKRAPHVWDIHCPENTVLTDILRKALYTSRIDFALQNATRSEKKLFISDMDATMVIGETIDDIGKQLGLEKKISEITQKAMQGELDFEQSLRQRLQLLKGTPKTTIIDLTKNIQLSQGADKLMQALNQKNICTCLVSGGFTLFSQVVADRVKFQYHYANVFEFDANERLTGNWVGDLVNAEFKQEILEKLANQLGISPNQAIAIGDGANDSLMIKKAGLGIAYHAKEALRKETTAEIHSGSIDNLLWFL